MKYFDFIKHINILFIICGVTGILLIFLIFWNDYQSRKLTLYVDSNNQFTIKYPPDWIVRSDLAGAAVIFNSPLENDLDLQKFIARSVKYPLEAKKIGIQSDVTAHFSVSKKGKVSSITMGQAKGDNVFIIDEVVVTALKQENVKQKPSIQNVILEKEVTRLLKKLPSISDQRMLGKTIQMKVKFRLQ